MTEHATSPAPGRPEPGEVPPEDRSRYAASEGSSLQVWTERDGALLRLRLARPKANIVDAAMIAALAGALDAGRQQIWPRLYETLGEDPYLATVLGVAAVRGYQGDDPSSAGHAAATLKHYIG